VPDVVNECVQNETVKSLEDYLIEFPVSTHTAADIFLGGSCNPAVWRFAEAIPAIDDAGLSYFNPQVKDWTDDLFEKEALAKESAKVLLFVIDDETRAIASMVEAAEFIARGRPTVLVILDVPQGAAIGGEEVGPNQLKDINRGRKFLADVAKRHNFPVYSNLKDAMQKVIEMAQG